MRHSAKAETEWRKPGESASIDTLWCTEVAYGLHGKVTVAEE
jgi:hypothetical protein